ncbi:WecB/TagA/CpsF family glycosyltransferase [Geofilum sp. OHC36d9]|uniref:WecB/TagA/CpsF family glycosyltransferase n=1 Tax=Geofilum sp. OHC36d9 TaxID=3458413 RepID=UPI004033EAB7
MESYFNVRLEFRHALVDEIILNAIDSQSAEYVCAIESNNLTVANTNDDFLRVVNQALVNICDGSVLATMIGRIYKQQFTSYIGADLFIKYIQFCKYKQYFLGNTQPVLEGLKENLSKIDPAILGMPFVELPFRDVDGFDYESIAADINRAKPDIIWVSLGAPKQELFMSRLLPYLDKGIMFGLGAVFNFFSGVGRVKRAPALMRKLKLEWLYRAFEEPHKNVPRYWNFIKILPRLIFEERKKLRKGRVIVMDKTPDYNYVSAKTAGRRD